LTDGLWRVRTTVITWAHKLQDATGLLTSGSSHLIYSVLGYKFWLSTDTLVICSVGVCVSIFRSYDVRGIYGKDIDEGIMKRIGAAFCKVSTKTIVIANDMRVSSESLKRAFISGCNRQVIDCGRVPLGVGMMHALGKHDFAYITASHMPKEWNGVKFFHKSGIGFHEEENKSVEKIFNDVMPTGKASIKKEDLKSLIDNYKRHVAGKIKIQNKLHVVIDCGNGMASIVAKDIFEDAGCSVESIFDTLDGTFPGRGPDPSESDLNDLKKKTLSADIGIAYDGDGDRMVIVDGKGRKLTPEQTSYLILLEAVKNKGPIVANVECTRLIDDIAKKFNKKVIRVPVGHTFMMQAVDENKACFGIEVSGHYTLPYMAPIDDSLMVSIYAAAVLSRQDKKLSEIVDSIKTYPFGRTNFDCDDKRKFIVIEKLRAKFKKDYKNVTTMDGVRVDFPDGWILVRASNTSPTIRLTVEAENKKEFETLKKKFSEVVSKEIKN